MKRFLTVLSFVIIASCSYGGDKKIDDSKPVTPVKTETANQNKQYVTWTYSQKKISADEFELTFKATIEPTWHLYSQIETFLSLPIHL